MEIPTDQSCLEKATSPTGMGGDSAEPASIAPVAEASTTTTASADIPEKVGAKGEILRSTAAAPQGEDIRGKVVSPSVQVVDAVLSKESGVAAGGDDSRERAADELRQEKSIQGDTFVEVGRKKESGQVANSAPASSRSNDIAGARSCEDAGKGAGVEEEGGDKAQQKAAEGTIMPEVAVSETALQLAEAALARLFDTHDNFFSSDKDEKQVRVRIHLHWGVLLLLYGLLFGAPYHLPGIRLYQVWLRVKTVYDTDLAIPNTTPNSNPSPISQLRTW